MRYSSSVLRLAQRGFTLIELIMVVIILAILMSLVFIGLGDSLEWAKVNRSAYLVTVAFDEARQATLARSLNHTIVFSSTKDPRDIGEIARVGQDVDDEEADYVVDILKANGGNYGPHTVGYLQYLCGTGTNNGNPDTLDASATYPTIGSAAMTLPIGMNTRRHFSRLVSKKAKDNWLAIFGPYKDQFGLWRQVEGGMPAASRSTADVATRRPVYNKSGSWMCNGGIFGHPLTNGLLAADRVANITKIAEAVWDPYNIMVGSRRTFERGTRWAARPDNPWWDARADSNPAVQLVGAPALFYTGQISNGNVSSSAFLANYNLTPSGYISLNSLDPTVAYPPSAMNYGDWRANDLDIGYMTNYFMAISSNKTKRATYSNDLSTANSGAATLTWDFDRPVAMMYLTLWASGEIVVNNQPIDCK